ncbi:hypothetical protein BA766_16035 [Stenotrophomonas maltophilia]|uniref:hypothetical protein n=1 Tax=Stenotrophomonas maltophilia TaxID=40324 RepID=UPI000810CBAA|nr:hypothetical protein [Stenotrophomonas maltophilia]OCK45632.1 hypothetical protein BA766_16035 [Stenotrophomonas maltophilia]
MNLLRLLPATLLCLPLIACGGTSSSPDKTVGKSVAEATSGVGETVKDAMNDARKDIAQGNIKISADKQPRAEITPDGRLLIAGKEIAANDIQRRHLQDYRGHVVAIAMDGMDVGLAGAKLGASAAGEALKGIFSGDSEGVEKRINAEAEKIEAQAKRICDRLPAMLASQQALARELPAFKPYATMDQSDVDDCGKDTGKGHTVNL